jgi:DNA/RNA-binding domain of Phe-tRNA-synthetase-like protein
MSITIQVEPHELFLPAAFECRFAQPLSSNETPDLAVALLERREKAPLESSEEVRTAVRSLLRSGGFKASGRSKPASEFLQKAAEEGILASINIAVDMGNVVSLHSGLPISVVDLDSVELPLKLAVVPDKVSYVFNLSGQELDLKGLLCLHDAQGPCASPVKDSQRSKTQGATRRTLCVIWGSRAVASQVELAETWYRQLLKQSGAQLLDVKLTEG